MARQGPHGADAIVTEFLSETGLYDEIWQFPVALLPCSNGPGESVVLRPILSDDAMTASAYPMERAPLSDLTSRLLNIEGVDLVFFDLTSKPPGTIEWE